MGSVKILPILAYARELVGAALSEGAIAVDGTVGNGHDTLFLAEQVGSSGRVYGFDVQEAALTATRERLQAAGRAARTTLMLAGHERMGEMLAHEAGRVRAVMFNLGYLPGSDKRVITRIKSTLPALDAALSLLAPEGIMTVVLYPGHEGGRVESEAVLDWARSLPPEQAQVLWYQFLNPRRPPPSLLAMQKRKGKGP